MKGSCLCGGVQYEVLGRPIRFNLDHCSRCRKSTGSAFGAWLICERDGFRWTAGESLVKKFVAPVKEKPPGYPRHFCAVCGGPVPYVDQQMVGIPAGTLDENPGVKLGGHIFVDFKAPWFQITDSLPQSARGPGS
jgi:hypothetical protein